MSEVIELKPKESTAITPMEMIDQALSNGAGVETLDKLMGLQERWEANQARKAFDKAMADLRGDLPEIAKSSKVDYTHNGKRTNYQYEDLSAVTSALSPVMTKHGLSFRWRTDQRDGVVHVTCIVSHKDGHYEETSLCASPDNSAGKNAVQSIGSTVTYLQRYTLKAAVGVAASADDDGRGGPANVDAPKQTRQPMQSPAEEAGPLIDLIDNTPDNELEGIRAKLGAEAKKAQLSTPAFNLMRAHYSAALKQAAERK